ncbi:AAA domain-containing protein [Actinomadura luteofluorescens]|uniref:AAA domain-containing protein n=1 Tax=Actinomadura luteofluorescens TaxID=46163 RepID=UPI0030CCF239
MASVDDVDRLVRHFCFDGPTCRYGPFSAPAGKLRGEPVIEGSVWFYRLVDAKNTPVDLHVYTGLADLGGALWEQELRVLLRLGNSALRAVPEVLSGGYQEDEDTRQAGVRTGGVAFIATRGSDLSMATPEAAPFMRAKPTLAVNRFGALAEALAELHEFGVTHRDLSPATIYVDAENDYEMWIARFEMSTLISNLLDLAAVDANAPDSRLRDFFLRRLDGHDPLHYCPPERLPYLLEGAPFEEGPDSDVFSLAAIAWEWFLDPAGLPEVPENGTPHERVVAVRKRHRAMRDAIREAAQAGSLPAKLGALLARMLADDAESRLPAGEAANQLARDHNQITAFWTTDDDATSPRAVLYMPTWSDSTLLTWGWITHSSTTETGEDELRTVIADDLRDAQMLHVEHGAEPYVPVGGSNAESKREAKILLLGSRGAWFCQLYRRGAVFGRSGSPEERALIIKYPVDKNQPEFRRRLEDLLEQTTRISLPAIELFSDRISTSVLDTVLADRPSWLPLIDSVRNQARETPADTRDRTLIEWTLEYQGAHLQARIYPYTLVETDHGDFELQYDRKRDLERIRKNPLLTKIDDSRARLEFGEFFRALEETGGDVIVQIGADHKGRPAWHDSSNWRVSGNAGQDRIKVTASRATERTRRRTPPGTGWIRLDEDRGTIVSLRRQTTAYWELADSAELLRQFRKPRSYKLLPNRWVQAGEGLAGKKHRQTVRDMLSYQPFFAVQGPPGTGKTTLVVEAVKRYLAAQPGARVLISAQSGYALDNLAERLLLELGALDGRGRPSGAWPGVAMRIASGETRDNARVAPAVEPWMRERTTERELGWMRDRVDAVLGKIAANDPVLPVLKTWRNALRTDAHNHIWPELGDRLQRSANLVFATCAMATPENVTPGGARTQFDWVVLEEAAKAWMTEIAIPLVRGTRWTLIGDHKQIGAHGREDFERFIDSCAGDPSASFADIYARKQEHLEVFDAFERLFKHYADDAATSNTGPPLRRLETQFRMARPIAECVGRVFYPDTTVPADPDGLHKSGLHQGREIEPSWVRHPSALRGRSLVWLDTGALPDRGDEPRWKNPGEARLVAKLVRTMGGPPAELGDEGLAILTPYQDQLAELRDKHGLGPLVHTIHSFQGREADVVIVSLVRSTMRGGAQQSIGHLAYSNIINVMMSRARRLLVIVGDIAHFATVGEVSGPDLAFWSQLTTAVTRFGDVLAAGEVLGDGS